MGTHSIWAWRFLTGLRGVVVRLLRLLSRSRSEDEDTVRVADVNAFLTSIALEFESAVLTRRRAAGSPPFDAMRSVCVCACLRCDREGEREMR